MSSLRSILVFRIGSIGDTVIALPALRKIRESEPGSRIVLLTNSPVDGGVLAAASHAVLRGSGLIDDYIEYPHADASVHGKLRLAQTLRQRGFSAAYYLMPLRSFKQRLRDWIFLRVAGVGRLHGLKVLTDDRHRYDGREDLFESESHRLVRSIGLPSTALCSNDFDLGLSPDEYASVAQLGTERADGPLIAVCTGGKAPVKHWGADHWRQLLATLAARLPDVRFVFVGAASERGFYESLGLAQLRPFKDLCGALTPRQTAALLEDVDLLITHDTGPMHLASAVNTACVSIFAGSEKPGIWFPFGQEHRVLYTRMACNGCKLSVCIAKGAECIQSISVDHVMAQVHAILNAPLQGREDHFA